MNIVNPKYLLLLLLLIPFVLLIIVAQRRYKKRFTAFADEVLWEHYFKDWSFFFFRLKAVLLIICLGFVIIALVRLQWDRETQDIRRSGLDIAICIDASKSMDAQDFAPSRLQRAKDQIASFIDELKGDRVALIPFAGMAFVQCPLTDDYEAARMLLSSLNTNSVPVWGTDIGAALKIAGSTFDNKTKTKVVILISDGEDLSDSAVDAAKELAQKGIIVYTMGVGTPQGVTIRLSEDDNIGNGSQDEIITKLDNKTLEKVASVTSGQFFMITPTQDEIQAILKHIASLEKSKLSSLRMNLYKEQYHLFAIVALMLLLIETLLTAKVNGNAVKKPKTNLPIQSLMLLGILLFTFNLNAINLPWTKSLQNSKGNAIYKKQDYQKAEEVFGKNSIKHPKDKVLQYNHGNSLSKLKRDKEAAEAWQKALDSKDNKLKSKAWHNLGNQQYQAKQYADAMQSYRKAVLSDNQNKDAKLNYDLAKRMLMIKQQQNQQNQQQKQDKNNKDKDKPQPKPEEQKQDQNKKEDTERILKALEQKEVNDRLNRQGTPQKMRNNKWW